MCQDLQVKDFDIMRRGLLRNRMLFCPTLCLRDAALRQDQPHAKRLDHGTQIGYHSRLSGDISRFLQSMFCCYPVAFPIENARLCPIGMRKMVWVIPELAVIDTLIG